MKSKDLKLIVKEKYGQIAEQSKSENASSCCGATASCCEIDYSIFSDDYSALEGYHPDADLSLGCGLPTEFADIKPGDHVLDLGSGAGNDCFVARSFTGESGKVTGLDFTEEMLKKANENVKKLGYKNVEFVIGDIEEMPLKDKLIDVVISNCVLNLVPDKEKAFKEMYRVLKAGAHFCVSDVVILGELPEALRNEAEMYAGCVSGAIQKEEYLQVIKDNGFKNVQVRKEKKISIPEDILRKYLSEDQLKEFNTSNLGVFSITVTGEK